jgi:excisionase family DNA binding protein
VFTVKAVAERLGVQQGAVLGWIAAGELSAVNVARNRAGERPRWRISADALQRFELGRLTTPAPPRGRRRKRPAVVVEFYPSK